MKSLWISMVLAVVALVTSTQADVFIVSDPSKAGGPEQVTSMTDFLHANFTATELGTIETDTYATGAPAAGVDDLVIFMRTLNNGAYDDSAAEIAGWNNLTAGILMISPYQADKDNLGWSTTGAQSSGAWGAGAETLVTDDSLFAGVDTNTVPGYADLINDASSYRANVASAFVSTDVVGSTAAGKVVLARIAAGSAWNETTYTSSGTHGGDRIVFQYAIEPSLVTTDLTADGQLVLKNVIRELVPPSQGTVITIR